MRRVLWAVWIYALVYNAGKPPPSRASVRSPARAVLDCRGRGFARLQETLEGYDCDVRPAELTRPRKGDVT
jgi:hypothetical protein